VLEIGKRKPVCARLRAVDSAVRLRAVHFVGAGHPGLFGRDMPAGRASASLRERRAGGSG
jgi:hypothetical protein